MLKKSKKKARDLYSSLLSPSQFLSNDFISIHGSRNVSSTKKTTYQVTINDCYAIDKPFSITVYSNLSVKIATLDFSSLDRTKSFSFNPSKDSFTSLLFYHEEGFLISLFNIKTGLIDKSTNQAPQFVIDQVTSTQELFQFLNPVKVISMISTHVDGCN